MFEVTDLDHLRNQIAALEAKLAAPSDAVLSKFDRCAALPIFGDILNIRTIPKAPALAAKIDECASALLRGAGATIPDEATRRLDAVREVLNDLRGKTFPVKAFERKQLAGWNAPIDHTWSQLETYVSERAKVDEETRRLVALFKEALKLPALAGVQEACSCPLCGTENGLSHERVQTIRQHVVDTKDFDTAETRAKTILSQLSASASNLAEAIVLAQPLFCTVERAKRRTRGFTIVRLRQLLGPSATPLVDAWMFGVRSVLRAARTFRGATQEALAIVENERKALALPDFADARSSFAELQKRRSSYAAALARYDKAAQPVIDALNAVLDAQSDTTGWQDLLDVAGNPGELHSLLIERAARASVSKELDAALKQIDVAKEKVLDSKFSEYSGSIQTWWERLRPDELTFFSAVQPRKGAKRTIDFKAGLSPNPDRSAPKLRDVIAIFSQSQLHCLGLALFLAKAEKEGIGFIVLDDPVLSSDEDYRVHFNSTVLTALLAVPIQVIVLTQDHDTWEELEIRYRHVGITTAQLYIETPLDGTIIENTSDALLAKLNRAKSLARGGHPDLRKECGLQLRDAGERFCKEMLVLDRRNKGEGSASLTDYDGKTLEWLAPRVEPLLDRDPSHPGKFGVLKNTVNDACHDNAPPGTAFMISAHGEMHGLVKAYLGR